jgi:DNA-binding HxlR family transcriptional regulator
MTFNDFLALTNRKVNPTLLSERLQALIEYKIISVSNIDAKKCYKLTPAGKEFKDHLMSIKAWCGSNGLHVSDECLSDQCDCVRMFSK